MPEIRLLEINETLDAVFRAGLEAMEREFGVRAAQGFPYLTDVINPTLRLQREVPRDPPFGGYLTADAVDSTLVGACGFVSGPKDDASVEMAYYTYPPFEGRGYATATARTMIELARASRRVRCIFAYTLPEKNASCRILEKVGMRFAGEILHPTDGRVWRWEQRV